VSLYRKSFLVETSPKLFKLVGFCWSELSACAVVRLYCGGNIMLTFLNNHWWGRVLLESLYRKSFSNSVLLFFLALFHFLTLLPSWAVVVFWGQTPYSRMLKWLLVNGLIFFVILQHFDNFSGIYLFRNNTMSTHPAYCC